MGADGSMGVPPLLWRYLCLLALCVLSMVQSMPRLPFLEAPKEICGGTICTRDQFCCDRDPLNKGCCCGNEVCCPGWCCSEDYPRCATGGQCKNALGVVWQQGLPFVDNSTQRLENGTTLFDGPNRCNVSPAKRR